MAGSRAWPPAGVRVSAGPLRGQVGGTQTGAGVKAGGYWGAGSGGLSAPALLKRLG